MAQTSPKALDDLTALIRAVDRQEYLQQVRIWQGKHWA